jgi:alpha-beta hydrolase superfamily lysophospholipase
VTTASRTGDHPLLSPEGGNGAELRGHVPPDPRSVVLLIHGGAETGTSRVRWSGLAALRMVPFALALTRRARRSGEDVAVIRLKNRIRGWNGAAQDPLVDARWALDRVRRTLPGTPVVLVGHSMGGRVVLRLADEPAVAGLAALAPWIAADARRPRPGIPVLLVHGTKDRITDPRRTAALAARFAAAGVDVRHVPIDGGDHPMVRQASTWHDLVADFVSEVLAAPGRTS